MSYSRYKAFVTAVECGSVTKAAEILGYTQSGVSHLIDSLEDELGLTLLIRSRSGCTLTDEGNTILPYIRNAISAADSVQEMASDMKGLKHGNLRIGTFSSVALQWLPGLLNAYISRFPGVNVEIFNGTYSTLENELFCRHLDCAFVTSPKGEEARNGSGKVVVMHLAEDPLMALFPSGHRLASCSSVKPAQLAGEDFIVPAEGPGYDISSVFSGMPEPPHIRFDMSDDFAAIGMVRAGLGITVLPQLLLKDYPMEGLSAVQISGISRHIGLAYNSDYISPPLKAFIDLVTKNNVRTE